MAKNRPPSANSGSAKSMAERRQGIFDAAHERGISVEAYVARHVKAADAVAMGFNVK